MIEWNKVTWYSKLAAIIFFLGIFPVTIFHIGRLYQITNESLEVNYPDTQPATSHALDIEGINPEDISSGQVPNFHLSDLEDATTSLVMKDSDDNDLMFSDNRVYFSDNNDGDIEKGFATISVLGYAKMGGIPTAVTLAQENTGGTGYFPFLVLYQAPEKYGATRIVSVTPIDGDRISIKSLSIANDSVALSFYSRGSPSLDTSTYRFVNGNLVKNK